MVLKFLSEESFTHLFWIDSDIAFQSDAAFRLLRADRDVCRPALSDERFNGRPLPAGWNDVSSNSRPLTPTNPLNLDRLRSGSAPYRRDGFVEFRGGGRPLHCDQTARVSADYEKYPQLNYVPDGPPDIHMPTCHCCFFVLHDRPDSDLLS